MAMQRKGVNDLKLNKYDVSWMESDKCQLDRYNSCLMTQITDGGYTGVPLSTIEGCSYMWMGAKGTFGIIEGKASYEVTLLENLPVNLSEEQSAPHVLRIGWSVETMEPHLLGEQGYSYGYGGTGKFAHRSQFNNYGRPFKVGDTISAVVEMEGGTLKLLYFVNGVNLGVAYSVNSYTGGPLFPHILSKNISYRCNFGLKPPRFPLQYPMLDSLPPQQKIRSTLPPATFQDCEFVMMCGLPAAGKTHWIKNHVRNSVHMRYNVLGSNDILERMKVEGLRRNRNYAERWQNLIQISTGALRVMMDRAVKVQRNYILDQTNVYFNAQKKKLFPFKRAGFSCSVNVVVPSEVDYQKRMVCQKQAEGKNVPEEAVLEMKKNFVLPEEKELGVPISFLELQEEDARQMVEHFRSEGAKAPPSSRGGFGRGAAIAPGVGLGKRGPMGVPQQDSGPPKRPAYNGAMGPPAGRGAAPFGDNMFSGRQQQGPQQPYAPGYPEDRKPFMGEVRPYDNGRQEQYPSNRGYLPSFADEHKPFVGEERSMSSYSSRGQPAGSPYDRFNDVKQEPVSSYGKHSYGDGGSVSQKWDQTQPQFNNGYGQQRSASSAQSQNYQQNSYEASDYYAQQGSRQSERFSAQSQNQSYQSQYSGQSLNQQYSGQSQDLQYSGQTQDQLYSGQSQDQQYSGQTQDQQYSGQSQSEQYSAHTGSSSAGYGQSNHAAYSQSNGAAYSQQSMGGGDQWHGSGGQQSQYGSGNTAAGYGTQGNTQYPAGYPPQQSYGSQASYGGQGQYGYG